MIYFYGLNPGGGEVGSQGGEGRSSREMRVHGSGDGEE